MKLAIQEYGQIFAAVLDSEKNMAFDEGPTEPRHVQLAERFVS